MKQNHQNEISETTLMVQSIPSMPILPRALSFCFGEAALAPGIQTKTPQWGLKGGYKITVKPGQAFPSLTN